jgi:uracil-DNA glycosylase family 4
MRRVNGTGNRSATLMLIGQRPGREEMARGVPFCGKSGQELDRYLLVNSGIDRADVFVTNLVRDYDGEDEITPEEIERDWPDLIAEIDTVKPRYIGLVGLYAARAVLGQGLDLDWSHGLHFPLRGNRALLLHQDATAMCLIHVAAGLHVPAMAAKIAYDFTQLGKLCRGEALPVGHLADSHPSPSYTETESALVLGTAAVDTEGSVAAPWCMSYAVKPGSAKVWRKGTLEVDATLVLHNSLHDLPVLEALGVVPNKWTDTMIMAALLGVEPQGLKPLARRHCGMVMSDYADITREARRDKALEYLSSVIDWAVAHGEVMPTPKKQGKRKRKPTFTEEMEALDAGFGESSATL